MQSGAEQQNQSLRACRASHSRSLSRHAPESRAWAKGQASQDLEFLAFSCLAEESAVTSKAGEGNSTLIDPRRAWDAGVFQESLRNAPKREQQSQRESEGSCALSQLPVFAQFQVHFEGALLILAPRKNCVGQRPHITWQYYLLQVAAFCQPAEVGELL